MKRSVIQERTGSGVGIPDSTPFHPGYRLCTGMTEHGVQRAHDLWQSVISFENLYRAAYQVLCGKRGKVHAGDFFFDLETNLFRLQRDYASGLLSWREVAMSLQAWNAHAEYGTTWTLRTDVFEHAPFIRSRSE